MLLLTLLLALLGLSQPSSLTSTLPSASQSTDPASPQEASPPEESSPEESNSDFSGHWETTFGPLTLSGPGSRLSGNYPGGEISGEVDGNRFSFWYGEVEESGEGWFEMAADGLSFRGRWRPAGAGNPWGDWVGRRSSKPQTVAPNFDGLWQSSFGRMRLTQSSDVVHGVYDLAGGATIEGRVSDQRLTFVYRDRSGEGDGWFELSKDGASFRGEWRGSKESPWSPWTGSRVQPVPGDVWLVVLEAYWESTLNERPYAFGEMLESYFQMSQARHVKVRHRFFHDAKDLERLLDDIPFLPGPVVLVVSSHGDASGIRVGTERIGKDALVQSLSSVQNLELLHLSGCSMAQGQLPEEVLAALPPEARTPISGYTTVVDWDASAIADFVYLSLLLIHRLPPQEAWWRAQQTAPYIGTSAPSGSGYVPLGLQLVHADGTRAVPPASEADSASPPSQGGSKSRSSIVAAKKILTEFHRCASVADFDGYFELFTSDAVFLGTDASERWEMEAFKTFSKPHFEGETAWTFVPQTQNVSLDPGGGFAWFDEELQSASYGQCRGTGVLRATPRGWRIAQYHLTVPIPNELLPDFVKRIRKPDADATRVILVRHAEKGPGRDPNLTDTGQARAERLTTLLKAIPIDHFFATEYKRTQQTVEPIATARSIDAVRVKAREVAALAQRIRSEYSGKTCLYAGHSNTVPALVKALGVDSPPTLSEKDYDEIFIVTIPVGGKPSIVQLSIPLP